MALQASSKVKGITIEIGADTTSFGYALSGIKKDAATITHDLKNVDNALKLNPNNVGVAADKLKLLREQAENATKKVNTIKAAIEGLNKEYANKSSKEYTDQLAYLKRQLESASREQEIANARLKDFEKNAGTAGQSAVSLGDMIKAHLTSQAILGGLQKLWDLAKGLARELIQAGKELFNFSKEAVDVAAQYDDAVGYSEKVFGGYAETVQQWVKDNSEFLRINISDLQVYANNLGTAFSALGLKREDAVKFSEDILNLSADIRAATGKDIDEIVNALTRGFTSSTRNFRQFGLFISEADIKIQALKEGVVEYSGDQEELNHLMLEYTHAAADANKALELYKEDSDQFREAEEKANLAAEALNALLGDQEVTLSSSERAVSLYNLVMERLGFLMGQNEQEAGLYNSQLALLRTKFANLKLEIGSKLLPVFTDLITTFNNFISSEEGKQFIDSIVSQFEKWANTINEMVQDGTFINFLNDMGEKLPTIVENIGNIVQDVIELTPYLLDGAEALLTFFGVGKEADIARATEEYTKVKDAVESFAQSQGISLDTAKKAVEGFATENNLKVYQVYQDWSTYEPKMAEYIGQYSTSAGTAEQDVSTAMDGMSQAIADADNNIGSMETTGMERFRIKVRDWAHSISGFFTDVVNAAANSDSIGDFFFGNLPGRASGGAVRAGQMYQVNDDAGHRPEIFVPSVPGTILNGNQTDKIMNNYNNSRTVSGGINIYVTSNALTVDALVTELGVKVDQRLRMSGAML